MTIISKNKINNFYQGDSFTYKLEFEDEQFDIRGYQFIITFKVAQTDPDSAAILIKRFTPPDNVNSKAGRLYLPFESNDTAKFMPGSYFYDIQLVTNDFPAKVFTLIKSKVTSVAGITQFEG